MVKAVDCLLFSILVLGCFTDLCGNLWRRDLSHLYMVEVTLPTTSLESNHATHPLLHFLPSLMCLGPKDVKTDRDSLSRYMYPSTTLDRKKFLSQSYQIVYQYLKRFDSRTTDIDIFKFQPGVVEGDEADFLKCIFKYVNIDGYYWYEAYCHLSLTDTMKLKSHLGENWSSSYHS